MTRARCEKECKICARPCTGFRWQPGRTARYKTTIICQMCARVKNVCQVCLFDLQYGLPVQVRDKFLESEAANAGNALSVPTSRVNRNFAMSRLELETIEGGYDKNRVNPVLQRLARVQPYYKRNATRVCTFWLKGECNRGDSCPFRHEKDNHDPNLSAQKIKERYYGLNDPVANNILTKYQERQKTKDHGESLDDDDERDRDDQEQR